jgi:hypothetical protein
LGDDAANEQAAFERAEAAVEAGQPQEAFSALRPILEYPGTLARRGDQERWKRALGILASAGETIAGPEFRDTVLAAAQDPDQVSALYALGYELYEQRLFGLAATVLARANVLEPGEEPILTEFVAALEGAMKNADACAALRAAPESLRRSFMGQYLLAFNGLMTGDTEEARRMVPALRMWTESDQLYMTSQLEGMLARADALRGVSSLDDRDLRGWHFVVNGALLLHVSPFGFEESMRGRYSVVQDSYPLILEGARRLAAMLQPAGLSCPRVFMLPDRASAVLAKVMAKLLSCRIETWPEDGAEGPGLLSAYDIDGVSPVALRSLVEHRPGQILWSHASCWTDPFPFTPDVVTFLYQRSTPPWEGQLSYDTATGSVVRTSPSEETVDALAERVLSAELAPDALSDLPALTRLVAVAKTIEGEHAGGLWLGGGRRRHQRAGSPVPSARFW